MREILSYKKTDQLTEDQLVEGCRKNKRTIQKLLYDQYCDAMFTLAYRIVNDYDIASDALQEAFIQVFTDIGQFRGDASLGSWIKTITIRTAIRKIKKENTFRQADYFPNGETISWPEEMRGNDLEKAILALPEGARAVFLLIEVEGYKHREVAEILNISEGTSKSQLSYAKKLLQQELRDFIEK
ncbi:MAG TPA: RNA polymerase sigma factor [Bacteroidales bacterium]|nr:RNA polymerase sigma factor [Bacteroidales bacterium]